MRRRSLWMRLLRRSLFPSLVLVWTFIILYPNPGNLVVSVQRIMNLKVDPDTVASLANQMPSNPVAVERAVLELIPYSYDWQTYGMPWYVPTVEQVLGKGRGDCKARALVLASILEAKQIAYTINYSPVHVWVDYEGKEVSGFENDEVKLYQRDTETGEWSLQMPRISFGVFWNEFRHDLWSPMPMARKVLLFGGLAALIWLRLRHWKRVLGR